MNTVLQALKKWWKQLVGGVLAIFLAVTLFKKRKNPEVSSLKEEIKASRKSEKKVIDILEEKSKARDALLQSQAVERAALDKKEYDLDAKLMGSTSAVANAWNARLRNLNGEKR